MSEPDTDSALDSSREHFHFSDTASDHEDDDHVGDYSTRMEELFDSDEEDSRRTLRGALDDAEDEDEDDEEFVYTGVDADVSTGYRDRLRDVLGPEHDEEDSEAEEVENSLLATSDSEKLPPIHDDLLKDVLSDHTPSTPSMGTSLPMTPPRTGSPANYGSSSRLTKPFLHPTVSRLRSFTPQASRTQTPTGSVPLAFDGMSPSPSHFSAISRMSSTSNLLSQSSQDLSGKDSEGSSHTQREVFRWSILRNITQHVYSSAAQKAVAVLGGLSVGLPTVLAANGLICIGTDEGRVCVYDFHQNLRCVCGDEGTLKAIGPVTAVALSHDHTYVASGHATGHIQLYDLKTPHTPARSVAPTSLSAVMSGRKEGHLAGSRIISIGFIAGRHTALVSADEHGLAFYHSLGKVLFVEASDILRILGTYPVDELRTTPNALKPAPVLTNGAATRRRTKYTILAMMPLPLGTSPHPTDTYNVIALLTPSKLVVVSLKPTPKTWFKCSRDAAESKSNSRLRGTLAWYPSVIPGDSSSKQPTNGESANILPTNPVLAYTWSNTLFLIRLSESRTTETVQNAKTGKPREVEVGRIVYESAGKWSCVDDILALQWLNPKQLVVATASALDVVDIHSLKAIEQVQFDGLSLISPTLKLTTNGAMPYTHAAGDVAHSMRSYKGKIFLLGRDRLQVGTLLTWADRILTFVENGDFLGAINLTRSYYVGDAPGNRNGLPADPEACKDVIGRKMRELMVASCRYAFSEDRMTDGTHITADGRGIDRTSLFEGLVLTCARACVALGDFEFLFEDLFQSYDDWGIARIYLEQLEPFVIDGEIRVVPPRITQRLVALHHEDERPDLVERVIWHIDPSCLDINQAIHLCQSYHLYDALIYVYTRALRDYVAPIVQLLGLIRKVQQFRKSRADSMGAEGDSFIESTIVNAFKIYPYLSNTLSGLTYPSDEPLSEEEAFQAKKDIYSFLFYGRSCVWPAGEGGKLVLTSDEEGGVEPTYPYIRQLLHFDAESLLHSLDIAFEDSYLNDESQGVSRLVIVRILLEVSGDLPLEDVTFVNIFIARNVPKYPQFLQMSPSVLHGILVALAEDPDSETREDRQLAAEYLLSVYNPHESERILLLFREAGFFRILRSWHRQDQQWIPLLSAVLEDNNLSVTEVFENVEEVVTSSNRHLKGALPRELIVSITDAIPQLLQKSIIATAEILHRHLPDLHAKALEALSDASDESQFVYLRHLLGPYPEDYHHSIPNLDASKISSPLILRYISLQCRFHPDDAIAVLKHFPSERLDWPKVVETCEASQAYDAAVWASNEMGDPRLALSKAEAFEKRVTLSIIEGLSKRADTSGPQDLEVRGQIKLLETIGRIAVGVCVQQSQGPSSTEVPLEYIWFQLLSSQVGCIQSVSEFCASGSPSRTSPMDVASQTLTSLRSMVQETFSSLVSITSTRAVSFPRLFKRLVNSASHTELSTGAQYNEFRSILTGMLESYRSDGDMLSISKHLVDRDLFEAVAEVTRERNCGWSAPEGVCTYCKKPLLLRHSDEDNEASDLVVVSRTGAIYHHRCLPP
ncbi:hypothetical protein HGRIS_002719 [Hohenbuehelia grisea]|uniref:Vacuolar protein sorting-associated protein 8 central domain-containing protein n=1 Tax=Hohenbuehelia grisea TaxID=104357 RepID=A0ABR3JLH3_9AGAR